MKLTAHYTIVRNSREFELALPCEVTQDSGAGLLSELCVLWSDEADATFAQYGFSGEELDGAVENAEDAFWLAEQAACGVVKTQQRLGTVAA